MTDSNALAAASTANSRPVSRYFAFAQNLPLRTGPPNVPKLAPCPVVSGIDLAVGFLHQPESPRLKEGHVTLDRYHNAGRCGNGRVQGMPEAIARWRGHRCADARTARARRGAQKSVLPFLYRFAGGCGRAAFRRCGDALPRGDRREMQSRATLFEFGGGVSPGRTHFGSD